MSPAATPRRRTPRGEGAALRERLLDVATELIDEQGGTANLSIRQITKRAGVSPMAFYLHFEDLPTLIREVVDRGFRRFVEAIGREAGEHEDPLERMSAMGAAYLRFAREEQALYTVIFGRTWPEGDRPPSPEESAAMKADPASPSRQAFEQLVAGVAACLGPGEDPEPVALGLWSALHGFALLTTARPGVGWPDDATYIAMLNARWLPPRPPAAPRA